MTDIHPPGPFSTVPAAAPTSAAPISADVLDRAADALMSLAAERPWREISLRDAALRAEVPFAELYARAPGKDALLDRFSVRLDRAAMVVADDPSPDAHDRLFEAVMARLEAMQPHRDTLLSIARETVRSPRLAARLGVTARALLETGGVDTSGARGALRTLAMTGVWARTLQVWRDDEGAYNRTMAEIDKRLKEMRRRLDRVRSGF